MFVRFSIVSRTVTKRWQSPISAWWDPVLPDTHFKVNARFTSTRLFFNTVFHHDIISGNVLRSIEVTHRFSISSNTGTVWVYIYILINRIRIPGGGGSTGLWLPQQCVWDFHADFCHFAEQRWIYSLHNKVLHAYNIRIIRLIRCTLK